MSGDSQARNHHWIPQCYLKGFSKSRSKNAKLFVVDVTGRKMFQTVPRNVASARDFNRVEAKGVPPNKIESDYSLFEGKVDRALGRLASAQQFDNAEDKNLVLNLIALLSVRNPRMRENSRQFQEKIVKQLMGLTLASKERYEASLHSAIQGGGVEENENVTYESMRDFFERGEYTIEVPTTRHVEQELQLVNTILPLLGARNWLLLKAPSNSSGFVTSDHPVVLQWSEQKDRGGFYSPGFGQQQTEVVFPVSSEFAMLGVFDGNEGVLDATVDLVAQINTTIISRSRRQIYALDDRFRYLSPSGAVRAGADIFQDLLSRNATIGEKTRSTASTRPNFKSET